MATAKKKAANRGMSVGQYKRAVSKTIKKYVNDDGEVGGGYSGALTKRVSRNAVKKASTVAGKRAAGGDGRNSAVHRHNDALSAINRRGNTVGSQRSASAKAMGAKTKNMRKG